MNKLKLENGCGLWKHNELGKLFDGDLMETAIVDLNRMNKRI